MQNVVQNSIRDHQSSLWENIPFTMSKEDADALFSLCQAVREGLPEERASIFREHIEAFACVLSMDMDGLSREERAGLSARCREFALLLMDEFCEEPYAPCQT